MFKNNAEAAAWLAGIIDGEGSIHRSGAVREVVVVNTDELILSGVQEACDQLGLNWRRYERHHKRLGTRRIWQIHLSGRQTLETLLKVCPLRSVKGIRLVELVDSFPDRPPKEKALSLYGKGMSIRQVSEKLGVPPSNVQLWVASAGLARGTGARALPVPEDLAEMSEKLGGVVALGKHYGVSSGTVSKWLNASGVARPAGRPKGTKWSAAERESRMK